MRNEALETAIQELEGHGITPEVWRGGKHYRLGWLYKGKKRCHTVPVSPSDHRSVLNNKTQLRRILRSDGLINDMTAQLEKQNVPQVIETPRLWLEGGIVMAGSLDVATHFQKPHKDVLRAIDRITSEVDAEFAERNFVPSTYTDASGKANRCFKLTRDGLSLLAMGFTGHEAMKWKLVYIKAFNEMEAELLQIAAPQELTKRITALESDLAAAVELIGEVSKATLPVKEVRTKGGYQGSWLQKQRARRLRRFFA